MKDIIKLIVEHDVNNQSTAYKCGSWQMIMADTITREYSRVYKYNGQYDRAL